MIIVCTTDENGSSRKATFHAPQTACFYIMRFIRAGHDREARAYRNGVFLKEYTPSQPVARMHDPLFNV